jgi:hypothetical protein
LHVRLRPRHLLLELRDLFRIEVGVVRTIGEVGLGVGERLLRALDRPRP